MMGYVDHQVVNRRVAEIMPSSLLSGTPSWYRPKRPVLTVPVLSSAHRRRCLDKYRISPLSH